MGSRPGRRLTSLAGWLGARRGADELSGRVAVLSPHLDDAVLSLGAGIARAARRGAEVTVVTVLAGHSGSTAPAGDWDSRCGFRTAGEATRARRAEDARACALVGASPVWLPFFDHQYDRGADDETILAALDEALGDAETVLVPGFPLVHEDHLWVVRLIDRRSQTGRRLGRYVEQPYTLWSDEAPDAAHRWSRLPATFPDRLAKLRACREYRSQVPLLGKRLLLLIARYEAARGGEAVSWQRDATRDEI